ncbi:MAG: hypothetical protein IKG27_05780 [Bacilli bacterium]|nr:hypothetical protein [Bacilli bacterium]
MAINLDTSLLNENATELLNLLNDKNYKDSIKLINKEIRYLNDQIKRVKKTEEKETYQNEITKYLYNREIQTRLEDIAELKAVKELVFKARKNPKAVRLNSSIKRFSYLSNKNNVRRANIKKTRTIKRAIAETKKDVVDIFYLRGFQKNKTFTAFNSILPEVNQLLRKYIGKDFTNSLKELLEDASPYNMTNEVADKVYSLGSEFINSVFNAKNDAMSEKGIEEIDKLINYLSLIVRK